MNNLFYFLTLVNLKNRIWDKGVVFPYSQENSGDPFRKTLDRDMSNKMKFKLGFHVSFHSKRFEIYSYLELTEAGM